MNRALYVNRRFAPGRLYGRQADKQDLIDACEMLAACLRDQPYRVAKDATVRELRGTTHALLIELAIKLDKLDGGAK